MAPLFLIVGLINILAQTKNYGIKIDNPDMIIRVRRDSPEKVPTNSDQMLGKANYNIEREKRQISFYTPKSSTNGITPRYNQHNTITSNNHSKLDYNFVTQNNGMLNRNEKIIRNETFNYYNNWRANYQKVNNSNGFFNPYNNTAFNNSNNNNGFNNRYASTGIPNNGYLNYGYNSHNTQYTSMPRFNTTGNGYGTNQLYSYNYNGYRYNNTGNWMYGYNNSKNISTQINPNNNKTGFGYHNIYPVYNSQTPKYSGYNSLTPKYSGYSNTESNVAVYNYQDPTKSNFNGYFPNNSFINVTMKPYAPGYLPIPILNSTKATNTSSYWGNNFNVTPVPFGKGYGGSDNITVTTTTETILSGCIICNIGCPKGKHRSGIFCVPDNYDYY